MHRGICKFFTTIKYVYVRRGVNGQATMKKLRSMTTGNVIEYVQDDITNRRAHAVECFFAALVCFCKSSSDNVMAYALKLRLTGNDIYTVTNEVICTEVNCKTRPVYSTHQCSGHTSCVDRSGETASQECPSILNGASYYCLGRNRGYPPRKS